MKIPGLEDKKADVKTNAAKHKPVNSKMHDIFKGWSIQPFNQGKTRSPFLKLSLKNTLKSKICTQWIRKHAG